MQILDDTIVALSTPPGRGAIALIRVSGPAAHEIAGRVIEPWPLDERQATRCALRHPESGALVDRPVVTSFVAPRSFTGEPMVEIATHGGLVAPASAIAALLAAGAREALPGEFTRRAVLHGKLDLLQAEAIGDLIDAGSRAAQRAALAQLDGGLSRRVLALREALLDLEAMLAYDIDFPEEDEGPIDAARIRQGAEEVVTRLQQLLATAPAGELVRGGALVVLAGAPNVGKSSLFNALLGQTRAIVTAVPGTTRDAVEAVLDTPDWPLRLVDTAGLRASDDVVERLGIEVSERYLRGADIVLACGDSGPALEHAAGRVRFLTTAPVIAVRTKSDLTTGEPRPTDDGLAPVAVSAETGAGLDRLLDRIREALRTTHQPPSLDAPLLTRERHRRAIAAALEEMRQFRDAWERGELPATVAAVHLRSAVLALEELVGAVDVEDVLDRLFATFCVGK